MTTYRFRDVRQGDGVLTFMDLIWAANKAALDAGEEQVILTPLRLGVREDREGRFVEEYEEADVVGPLEHNNDGWRVIPKTARADKYLRLGAISIGYPNIPEEA